jgi:hypothetical protein
MDNQQYELKPLAEMSDKEFEDYLFSLTYQNVRLAYPAIIVEAIYRIKDRAETISKLQKLTHPYVTLGVER